MRKPVFGESFLQMLRCCTDSVNNDLNFARPSKVDGKSLIISAKGRGIY